MRPARLELKGFTAYRDAQVLDFANLDLFAVTGPTGSGKSSLLDAMTYALFGKVARVGVQASHLIAQGQPRLSVMFDFDVDGRRYRVSRSTGRRAAQSAVRLERRVGDEWVSFGEGADRIRDATRLITELIGLDYRAFTRSVLLPQGQFADFLVGDPGERRDILTELLDLRLFERMAGKAGELARAAKAAAKAKEEVLTGYDGVDQQAVKEARKRAKEAKAATDQMAAVERSLEILSKRWEEEGRRVDLLEGLAGEAGDIASQASKVAKDLSSLAEVAARAEASTREAEEAASTARERAEAARRAFANGEARMGTLEALAGLRARLEEFGRLQARLDAAERSAEAAGRQVESKEQALAASQDAAAASATALDLAGQARKEAEEEHERAHRADLVGAVTKGLRRGDPCPVCSRPLGEFPRSDSKALARAALELERAREAEKRAGDAWARADRDVGGTERDLEGARREARSRQGQLEGCRKERETLLPTIADAFGGEVPLDPIAEAERRIEEIQTLKTQAEALSGAAEAARAEAATMRERAAEVSARGTELVMTLRALALPQVLRRARAAIANLHVPPELTAAIPTQPRGAADAARSWAEATATLVTNLEEAAGDHRSARKQLLEEAQMSLPAGFPLGLVTDLEELVQAVRATARDLVVHAAEALKDAELITSRLEQRRALEKEVDTVRRESEVYQSLAGELRADRLISFLQGEALELLAEAGSERLLFLSQERYRLVFEDDEFFVEDRQNGDERRSVRTLSGGETFLASLALALALAEQIPAVAVTQRSRLQSLFIDEGFGALDAESLEVATEALSRLGGQDRLVGVITHVSELAEKMPVRVVVEKLPTGSRLEVQS